ncbi:MAG: integrase family protein [Pseudomonadales bacterium]
MTRLTKSFIDKHTPPAPKSNGTFVQKMYRDSALPGFALRVSGGGAKSFIVEKRINGKLKRITLGRYGPLTCEQARKEAHKLLGSIASGGDPVTEKKEKVAQSVTLQEAFDSYLGTRKDLKAATIHDYKRGIEGSLKDWCGKKLVDITKDLVQQRHTKLGAKSHARANNTMRVLRAVFNHAREQYEDAHGDSLFQNNPVDRLSQSRAWYVVERRRTLIKPHQLNAWYQSTRQLNFETTRDYLHFLLFTGLRRSEAARLVWDNIDLVDHSFTIPDTKNKEPHRLPMSTFLYDLLKRRSDTKEGVWVFPSPMTGSYLQEPKTAVAKVAELANVPFTLHDLRRTFITIAESLDIPGYALKRLLNHKDPNDVTAGYIISDVERLRKPMQRVTDFILGQIENEH